MQLWNTAGRFRFRERPAFVARKWKKSLQISGVLFHVRDTSREPTWHPPELLNSCRFSVAIKIQKKPKLV
jgi:hypothetical protein